MLVKNTNNGRGTQINLNDMKKILFVISIITPWLMACSESKTDDLSLEKEKIENLFKNWINEVSESENPDTYFKFVTEDFILSEPNSRPKNNRDSLRSEVKYFLTTNSIRLGDWKSEEIIIRNDIAIHRHSGDLIIKPKNDTTEIKVSLKYLDILKKNNMGEWKIYLHSNMPDQ
mgnify:CR=1 FL=1